jgi:hypothetical protein
VLAAALLLVLLPAATAAGPPVDIEPAGSVPRLLAMRGTAASPDAIVTAALKKGGVDAATRAADIRLLRRARSLARRLKGAAGTELAAVAASAVRIARTSGYTPERARATFLEVSVNMTELRKGLPPVHARKRIDSLTFERYPGQGLRIQPLATWWFARDTARHGDVAVTKRLLDKALSLSVPRSGGLTTEYLFPFGSGAPPWSSPMAHSLAMDALARGFALTGDERYRTTALQFAKGVASSDVAAGAPVWFPIYPFDPGLRVLNADLQVIIGLQQVAKLDGAEEYADLAARAAGTAEQRLPRYDTGAWSRYSEQREAPLEYHDLQTQQLDALGKALKDAVFGDYGQTFADYRIEAPAFDVVPGGAKRIYPVPADGFRDTFAVKFTVTKLSSVVATWRRNGKKVRDQPLGLLSGGSHSLRWGPGRARPGLYTIGFSARDVAGNRGSVIDPRAYEIARDRTPPTIVSVHYSGGRLQWKLRDSETPWVNVTIKIGKKSKVLHRRKLSTSVKLSKAPSLVTFTDSSGNRVRWRRIVVPAAG